MIFYDNYTKKSEKIWWFNLFILSLQPAIEGL